MKLLAFAAATLLAGALRQAAPSPGERDLARKALDLHFGDVDKSRRDLFTERIALLLDKAPPERRSEAAAGLSSAAQYHSARLRSRLREAENAGALRKDLADEGFGFELEYLVARVERYLRRDLSDRAQEQRVQQSGRIFEAAERALAQKLTGSEAAKLLERSLSPVREVWIASLETPFNSCLERPLTPDELSDVLRKIQDTANRFDPIVIGAADAADEDRLSSLGVPKMINDVLDAAYTATSIVNRDLAAFGERRSLWQNTLKEAIQRARSEKLAHPERGPTSALPTKSPDRPSASLPQAEPAQTAGPSGDARGAGRSATESAAASARPDSTRTFVLIGSAFVLIALAVFTYRRLR